MPETLRNLRTSKWRIVLITRIDARPVRADERFSVTNRTKVSEGGPPYFFQYSPAAAQAPE